MGKLFALLLVAAVLVVGCGSDSAGESTPSPSPSSTDAAASPGSDEPVALYAEALRAIDAEWQTGVDAAFEGREYLRTGALPDDFEPTTEALNNLLDAARGNLEELIQVTSAAREDLATLEPPPSASSLHASYGAVLDGFEQRWSDGLNFIEEGDAEGFLRFYVTFQPEREALELTLNSSREELDRLASEG